MCWRAPRFSWKKKSQMATRFHITLWKNQIDVSKTQKLFYMNAIRNLIISYIPLILNWCSTIFRFFYQFRVILLICDYHLKCGEWGCSLSLFFLLLKTPTATKFDKFLSKQVRLTETKFVISICFHRFPPKRILSSSLFDKHKVEIFLGDNWFKTRKRMTTCRRHRKCQPNVEY